MAALPAAVQSPAQHPHPQPTLPKYTRKARARGGRTRRATTSRRTVDLTLLNTFFDGISGFNVNLSGLENYITTYGEVTPEGIKELNQIFTAQRPLRSLPSHQRVFYDLGCGVGKVVLGMAMLNPSLQCIGFEIVPDRIKAAKQALVRAGQQGQQGLQSRCSFKTDSFLSPSVNLSNAGWIYLSNLCFSAETQAELAKKFEAEVRPGAVIVCSKEFPFSPEGRFTLQASRLKVPMSWSSVSEVFVYRCD